MSPSESYNLLKFAQYTPTAPPTVDTMKDNRGFFRRNLGGIAAGIGSAGLALAGTTMGLSTLVAGGIDAALIGGGMLADHFTKKKELANQTQQWRSDEQTRENAAVHDGSYYTSPNSGGMQGLIGATQAYTKGLQTPPAK